ncbi:MAG: hypothetical protein AAGD28_17260 [Bacteroidota bacterium]
MKTLRLLSLALLSLLFFACEQEILPEKPLLNKDELLYHVAESDEYQQYLTEFRIETQAILKKKREISKKEFELVRSLHQSYPLLEDFRSAADENLYSTYKKLTGIDLLSRNSLVQQKFEVFLQKLKEEIRYEDSDLQDVMFQLESNIFGEVEKTALSCTVWCMGSAAQYRQLVYNRCRQPVGGLSEPESFCQEEARFAFTYYLRGCLSGCSQHE